MSHDHTWFGSRATSSGRARADAWPGGGDLRSRPGCAAPGTWWRSTPGRCRCRGGSPTLERRQVHERLGAQQGQQLGGLRIAELVRRRRARCRRPMDRPPSVAVVRRPAPAREHARRRSPISGSSSVTGPSITSSTSTRTPRSASISKSVWLFPDLECHPRLGQFRLGPPGPAGRLRQRRRIRCRRRLRRRAGSARTVQRSGLPSSAPLHQVRGVQPLPAQQGALGPIRAQPVILGQDRQLVISSEPPSRGSVRRRWIVHRTIMGEFHQGRHGHAGAAHG